MKREHEREPRRWRDGGHDAPADVAELLRVAPRTRPPGSAARARLALRLAAAPRRPARPRLEGSAAIWLAVIAAGLSAAGAAAWTSTRQGAPVALSPPPPRRVPAFVTEPTPVDDLFTPPPPAPAVPAGAVGRTVHVAPTGRDEAPGTAERPFRTIQRGADALRPGDTCLVHPGVYRESVRPPRSGLPGRPLSFRAADGGPVVVSGAEPITGWRPAGAPGLFTAPLPALFRSTMNQADQVFVDGTMVPQARWPNLGADVSRPPKSTITRFVAKERDPATNWTTAVFEDAALPPAPDGHYVGMEIFVQPSREAWSWALSGTVVAHAGNRLTIRSRNDSGDAADRSVYAVGSRYFLFNDPKLLDAEGEWWIDRAAGTIHLRLPEGDDPSAHTVELKLRDYAFDLDRRSHVTVTGLDLFAATVTTDRAAGGDAIAYADDGTPRHPWRGAGTVAESRGVVLDGLRARYVSHFTDTSGHFFLQWGTGSGIVLSGTDHVLRNSVIRYSAGNGVTILGARHRVTNNLVLDTGYAAVDAAALNTGGAALVVDLEIDHNTVARAGRSCVLLRGLRNGQPGRFATRVHHNDLSSCMLQDWNGAGIYAVAGNARFVRIDHNRIHDIVGFSSAGIYINQGQSYLLDHNVVWNVDSGIFLLGRREGGSDILCYHNTLLVKNTERSLFGPFGFGAHGGRNEGTVLRNNLVKVLDPESAPDYRAVSDGYRAAEIADNLFAARAAPDPGFEGVAREDFTLRPDSPARDRGSPIPAVVRGGVLVPSFADPVVGTPDLGAYESGTEPWAAGATVVE